MITGCKLQSAIQCIALLPELGLGEAKSSRDFKYLTVHDKREEKETSLDFQLSNPQRKEGLRSLRQTCE